MNPLEAIGKYFNYQEPILADWGELVFSDFYFICADCRFYVWIFLCR